MQLRVWPSGTQMLYNLTHNETTQLSNKMSAQQLKNYKAVKIE